LLRAQLFLIGLDGAIRMSGFRRILFGVSNRLSTLLQPVYAALVKRPAGFIGARVDEMYLFEA
jgi:hypothetical protein